MIHLNNVSRTTAWYCKTDFEVGAVLEQSSTVNKTAEATKKVFLICTVAVLGPEGKKNPAVISLEHTHIHIHTHRFIFQIKIKDPMNHYNIIYLQHKTYNLSENLAVGFLH